MIKQIISAYYQVKIRCVVQFDKRIKSRKSSLETLLLDSKRTRWLDMGAPSNLNQTDFYFADLTPKNDLPKEVQEKFFQADMSEPLSEEKLAEMGKFDLVRMQHVFEHFTVEGGQQALENASKLLNTGGYLLMTVPDLRIFIKRYRNRSLDAPGSFKEWAGTRIDPDAPQSFYFSIFFA